MNHSLQQKYDAPFYANQKAGSLQSASIVLNAIKPYIGEITSILDVGCGVGGWLRMAQDVFPGAVVRGLDHPNVPRNEMYIDAALFEGADLSQPINLGRVFDVAISLEVAEHIPARNAETFVTNLTRHSPLILFSAASPRQGGTGHVNERWPSYWIDIYAAAGYRLYDVVRPLVWDNSDVASWYAQNTMLFVRQGHAIKADGLADWEGRAMVHPGLWMRATETLQSKISRALKGEKPSHAWR